MNLATRFAQIRLLANKIIREQDKRRHIGWSMALMLYFYLIFRSAPVALAASLFLGWIKELFDGRYGSGFCWYDMAANTVGVLLAVLVLAALGTLAHGAV
jgi:asparagine N-glycosylation enzyme membrane subunit Stt3